MRNSKLLVAAALAGAFLSLSGCVTNSEDSAKPTPPPGRSEAPRTAPPDTGSPVRYTELQAGMCSNHSGSPRPDQAVGVVDCATEHRFKIVGRLELPERPDAPFPGLEHLQQRIREGCLPLLRPVLDTSQEQVPYLLAPVDESSWANGNRVFYCAVTTPRQAAS